jgi:hypothetical protein
MSASKESASLPATNTEPAPTRVILPAHATSPSAMPGTESKLTVKQSISASRGKQRAKKGQRLDLRSLLQGVADESLGSISDDRPHDIKQRIAELGIQDNEETTMKPSTDSDRLKNKATMSHPLLGSTELTDETQHASKSDNVEALAKTITNTDEYTYDDDDGANYSQDYDENTGFASDTYDDNDDEDDISIKPLTLPAQARRSKKGKGDRWELPLDRKDLIGATDGPLAPQAQAEKKKKKKSKKVQASLRKERVEREKVRQHAIARAGGEGRLVGAQAGMIARWHGEVGGGKVDK